MMRAAARGPPGTRGCSRGALTFGQIEVVARRLAAPRAPARDQVTNAFRQYATPASVDRPGTGAGPAVRRQAVELSIIGLMFLSPLVAVAILIHLPRCCSCSVRLAWCDRRRRRDSSGCSSAGCWAADLDHCRRVARRRGGPWWQACSSPSVEQSPSLCGRRRLASSDAVGIPLRAYAIASGSCHLCSPHEADIVAAVDTAWRTVTVGHAAGSRAPRAQAASEVALRTCHTACPWMRLVGRHVGRPCG